MGTFVLSAVFTNNRLSTTVVKTRFNYRFAKCDFHSVIARSFRVYYLEDGEVFQHTVHHVFLRQVLELQDEVDHVLAHGAAVQLVDVAAILITGVLRLHLLHHLLAKAANFRRHLDRHVLRTLVPARIQANYFKPYLKLRIH